MSIFDNVIGNFSIFQKIFNLYWIFSEKVGKTLEIWILGGLGADPTIENEIIKNNAPFDNFNGNFVFFQKVFLFYNIVRENWVKILGICICQRSRRLSPNR